MSSSDCRLIRRLLVQGNGIVLKVPNDTQNRTQKEMQIDQKFFPENIFCMICRVVSDMIMTGDS